MIALDLHTSSFLVLYFCLMLIEFLIWRKRKNKRIGFGGLMIISLYVLILFKVTICPIVIIKDRNGFMSAVGNQLQYFQLIPFRTIISTMFVSSGWLQIIGNLLLLFPIPILCSLVGKAKNIRSWCVIGGMVSLGIEIVQLIINILCVFPSHVADIDDLILNLSGVLLGALLSAFFYDKAIFAKAKSYMVES